MSENEPVVVARHGEEQSGKAVRNGPLLSSCIVFASSDLRSTVEYIVRYISHTASKMDFQ
jgi:hypothetical protein